MFIPVNNSHFKCIFYWFFRSQLKPFRWTDNKELLSRNCEYLSPNKQTFTVSAVQNKSKNNILKLKLKYFSEKSSNNTYLNETVRKNQKAKSEAHLLICCKGLGHKEKIDRDLNELNFKQKTKLGSLLTNTPIKVWNMSFPKFATIAK